MGIRVSEHPPLALIAGPTASGKSALALELAQRSGGVIVNADSAQVYRDLPILSAAPTPADRALAEHRLYGTLDAAAPSSAAAWAELAKAEIARIHARGKLPILVGGTGLYLRTLLDGIAPVPDIDPSIREDVRRSSAEDNRARLGRLDPAAAERLNPGDTSRIGRALEVVLSTGRPLAHWQRHREGGIAQQVTLRPLVLLPPRDWLHARCDRRFEAMMNAGAREEVQALLARQLSPHLPSMRAIGVREIAALLRGEIGPEEAVAAGQRATRQYAKRQYTWFSRQPPSDWPRFHAAIDAEGTAGALALLAATA